MIAVAIAFGVSVLASVEGSGQLNVAVSFPRVTVAPATKYIEVIEFDTTAGQQSYTKDDVEDLELIEGMEMKLVTMDSTTLTPAFRNWDDTTFTITNIDVAGGENIVIIAKRV